MKKSPDSKFKFMDEIKHYEPLIEAIVELFHPFVEAAVHDLQSGKLVMIYNNISKRNVGAPTPLKELEVPTEEFPSHFSPYYKQNWDGRALKCTSVTIKDHAGKPIGLICFNFDTSVIQGIQEQLESFLKVKTHAENPIEMFSEDWHDQVQNSIEEYLLSQHLSLDHLTRSEKKDLVQYLYKKGVFNFKNAPAFIAQKLSISRASIYNYLQHSP